MRLRICYFTIKSGRFWLFLIDYEIEEEFHITSIVLKTQICEINFKNVSCHAIFTRYEANECKKNE